MTSSKRKHIIPTVIRLNQDAVLPPTEEPERTAAIDRMLGEIRAIISGIPKPSGLALVEGPLESGPAKPRILSSRKFIVEAIEVDPYLPELKESVGPSVFETMKVVLGAFGMVPISIEVVEQ